MTFTKKKAIITAAGLLTLGILAVPTAASAANGGTWVLGKSLTETTPTTVTNSNGTPLSLKAKSGTAPLAVNSGTKVTNLNADKLDGYSSESFAMRSAKTATIVHDGYYDGKGAKCPSGTVFVSGGGFAPASSDYIWYAGPDFDINGNLIANSWLVMADNGVGTSNVTCMSLSGAAVSGAAKTVDALLDSDYYNSSLAKGSQVSQLAATKIGMVKDKKADH
jgi:hypothetical protein